MIRVAVIMGGPSSEHEVSLKSGKVVLGNLDSSRYSAIPVHVDRRGFWCVEGEGSEPLPEPEALLYLQRAGVGVAFIAMHGEYGEDGTIQRLLAAAEIPYTGSAALPSALAMNKAVSGRMLKEAGLDVPEFASVHYLDWARESGKIVRKILHTLGTPLVVKPLCGGSSVGVSLVRTMGDLTLSPLQRAIDHALTFGREAIVQKFARGRELTCGVLEFQGEPVALDPTEIIPVHGGIFDFKSKYTENQAKEITPPERMSAETIRRVKAAALRAHMALGLRDMSRTDMILGANGQIYVLEVNTIPGLTPTSLLPKAALAHGIKFGKLLDLIIGNVLRRASLEISAKQGQLA